MIKKTYCGQIHGNGHSKQRESNQFWGNLTMKKIDFFTGWKCQGHNVIAASLHGGCRRIHSNGECISFTVSFTVGSIAIQIVRAFRWQEHINEERQGNATELACFLGDEFRLTWQPGFSDCLDCLRIYYSCCTAE